MIRQISACALGIILALQAAFAMEPPATQAPLPLLPPPRFAPMPTFATDRESMAQRMAQFQVNKEQAVAAFVNSFPEVFQGPEQSGVYAAALLLRPDGSVYRSIKVLLPAEELEGNVDIQWQPLNVNGGSGSQQSWIRGTTLAPGKTLRIDVALHFTYLPAGYDEARSELKVQDAVIAKHANLALASDADSMNWLRVYLNEDGTIAREHVETLQIADLSKGDTGPRAFKRLADQFEVLGLRDEDLGVMGTVGVEMLADGTLGSSPMAMGRPEFTVTNGVPRMGGMVMRRILESRHVMVSYAWPRRPGEPPGGVSGHGIATPQPMPTVDPAIALAIIERHLPGAFTPAGQVSENGPWVLLSSKGEVLRTGLAPSHKSTFVETSGEAKVSYSGIDTNILRNEMPGIQTATSWGMVVENASGKAHATFVWLTPDSPLPLPAQ